MYKVSDRRNITVTVYSNKLNCMSLELIVAWGDMFKFYVVFTPHRGHCLSSRQFVFYTF